MLHWRRIKVYARSVWDVIIIITAFCLANDGHLLFSAQWLQKPLRGSWWEVLTRGWLIYCPPPTHTHTLYPTPNTHTLPLLSQHRLSGLHALLLFLSRPYLLSFLVNSSSVFSPHLTSLLSIYICFRHLYFTLYIPGHLAILHHMEFVGLPWKEQKIQGNSRQKAELSRCT